MKNKTTNKETIKEESTTEETIQEQLLCLSCDSRRLQLLSINYNQHLSKINLLCLDCGLLLNLKLGMGIPFKPQTTTPHKIEGGYWG